MAIRLKNYPVPHDDDLVDDFNLFAPPIPGTIFFYHLVATLYILWGK